MIPLLSVALMLAGIDHILLGVPDLQSGVRAFEQATGVTPVYGGKHPNRGTENALVSLGNGVYLELIAPQPQPDAQTDLTRQLAALKQPALIAWAARSEDIAALRAALTKAGFATGKPTPGARVTPSGTRLEWTTLDTELETAPFFIQWRASTVHPSASSPGGCVIKSFEVEDPNAEQLTKLLQAAGVTVPVKPAPKPALRLLLQCGTREINVGPALSRPQ
jgi:hypothetical protein